MTDKIQRTFFDVNNYTLGHVICGGCNRMVNIDYCECGLAEWRHVFCCFCCAEISIDDGAMFRESDPIQAEKIRRRD